MDDKSKSKRGRPSKVWSDDNLQELQKLLAMQATDEEIAAWFGITRRTLNNHKVKNKAFREIYDGGKDKGKASLRRLMWQAAQGTKAEVVYDTNGMPVWDSKGHVVFAGGQEPNITMQIFMAKNILGWRDNRQEEKPEEKPPAVEELTDEQLNDIAQTGSSSRTLAAPSGQS